MTHPTGRPGLCHRLAHEYGCAVPDRHFAELAQSAPRYALHAEPGQNLPVDVQRLERDRHVGQRISRPLEHPDYPWRTLERVAIEAAVSGDEALDVLWADDAVRFSKNPEAKTIVGLRSRVDGPERTR